MKLINRIKFLYHTFIFNGRISFLKFNELKTGFLIRISVCIVFLLVIGSNLKAQSLDAGSLKGSIVDEQKIPIPFAYALLLNKADSSILKSVISDDKGKFIFNSVKNGDYIIKIKMLGFESLQKSDIKIDQNTPVVDLGVLSLTSVPKLLNAVNITAQKSFIERRADKMIINLDNAITAGNSIMEVMDKLPGVQVTPSDQISLNGKSVQIYIDGKASPLSSEALSSLLKGMSSSNIEKVELIAHPSSKYDAAGGNGIINIIRKKNHKEGPSGSVYGTIGAGSYIKNNGGLNLNYRTKTFNFFFNMDYSYNKYFLNNNITTEFFDKDHAINNVTISQINSFRNNRTYTPTVGFDFSLSKKTTLSISAIEGFQIFNKDANSVTDNLNFEKYSTGRNDFSNLVKTNSRNIAPGIHLVHQIDTLGKEYTVDIDYYNYYNNSDQNNLSILSDSVGNFINNAKSLYLLDRNFKVYSAKADYTHPLKNGATLEAGWKSSYVVSNNTNMFYDVVGEDKILIDSQNDFFRYTENINALYVNFNKDYKKFSYKLGLRAENTTGKGEQIQYNQIFNKNYFQLFPSAYFDYKISEKHGFNISLNKNVTRPTYENLNPLIRIINSTTYLQGNPNLRPANAYNGSATYSYDNAFFATFNYGLTFHDFTYSTSLYNNIESVNTTKPSNNEYSQYFNLAFVYNKQIEPWWFTGSGVDVSRQSFRNTMFDGGSYDPGIYSLNIQSYHSFNITKNFSFLVSYKYRSKSKMANIVTNDNYLVTAGIRQLLFNKKGSIAFNVTDIFHTFKNNYSQTSESVTQYWKNQYESRVARLSFSYSFGGKVQKSKTSNGASDEKKRTNLNEN